MFSDGEYHTSILNSVFARLKIISCWTNVSYFLKTASLGSKDLSILHSSFLSMGNSFFFPFFFHFFFLLILLKWGSEEIFFDGFFGLKVGLPCSPFNIFISSFSCWIVSDCSNIFFCWLSIRFNKTRKVDFMLLS